MIPLMRLDSPELDRIPTGLTPEAKVLIVMTGGTICMERSPNGLVPARNFVDRCMAVRPEFNDASEAVHMEARIQDGGSVVSKQLKSLRTPLSAYGKRIRYVLYTLEYSERLLKTRQIHRTRVWDSARFFVHRQQRMGRNRRDHLPKLYAVRWLCCPTWHRFSCLHLLCLELHAPEPRQTRHTHRSV